MSKRLNPEIKDEIFRLRIEERKSSVEIQKIVGVSTAVYICQLLKDHPLTPKERKARRVRAVGKMRLSLMQSGHYVGGEEWTKEEDSTIKKFWPHRTKKRVQDALPGRSWAAIAKHAADLGIKRSRSASNKKTRGDKLIKDLREIRELRGISQQALADRIGIHVVFFQRCELGTCRPSFFTLRAWLDALGCDVHVHFKGQLDSIRKNKFWNENDEALLTELTIQGSTINEIALALKRRPIEVEKKCKELGLIESEATRNVSGMMKPRLGISTRKR